MYYGFRVATIIPNIPTNRARVTRGCGLIRKRQIAYVHISDKVETNPYFIASGISGVPRKSNCKPMTIP